MLGMDLDWTHGMVALMSAVTTLLAVLAVTLLLIKASE